MSNRRQQMKEMLSRMGVPREELDAELETYQLVQEMRGDKKQRRAMREAVKYIHNQKAPESPKTVEEALEKQQEMLEEVVMTSAARDLESLEESLAGMPETTIKEELSSLKIPDNSEEMNMENTNINENNQEINMENIKGEVTFSEEAQAQIDRQVAVDERMKDPLRDVVLSVLRRGVLPRTWTEGTLMIGGGATGAGVAVLAEASTGGVVTGTLLGVGAAKGMTNLILKDEVFSQDVRALAGMSRRGISALGRGLKNLFKSRKPARVV